MDDINSQSASARSSDSEVEEPQSVLNQTETGGSSEVVHVPNGLTVKYTYEQQYRSEILAATYSARMRAFILLDGRGFLIWTPHAVEAKFSRLLTYPKYEYRRYLNFVYSPKHNVYFAFSKDSALKVLDWKLDEIASIDACLENMISCMTINPETNQLITGTFGGFKLWDYRIVTQEERLKTNLTTLYKLEVSLSATKICEGFVRVISLDLDEQRMAMCTDYDVICTRMDGSVLQIIKNAHRSMVTGVMYCPPLEVLVSAAMDAEIRVFNNKRRLLHVFIGHTKPITSLSPHPHSKKLFFTAARDCMIRLWSLDLLACISMFLVSSTDFVQSLNTTLGVVSHAAARKESQIYLYGSSKKNVQVWSLNYVAQFWAKTRTRMRSLRVFGGPYTKSPEIPMHVCALGADNSVRLYRNEVEVEREITMVYPPLNPRLGIQAVFKQMLKADAQNENSSPRMQEPDVDEISHFRIETKFNATELVDAEEAEWMKKVKETVRGTDDKELQIAGVAYFATTRLAFYLVNGAELWVYTMRTSPACRAVVWSISEMEEPLEPLRPAKSARQSDETQLKIQSARTMEKVMATVAANKIPIGSVGAQFDVRNKLVGTSVCSLENCVIVYDTIVEQSEAERDAPPMHLEVSPDIHNFLALGLEDGRVVFLDPLARARKVLELKAHKDAVDSITYDVIHHSLITMSRLKEYCLFTFWQFPRLQMLHSIRTSLDTCTFAVLDASMLCGHQSGHLTIMELNVSEKTIINQVAKDKKVEHPGGVRAVDASAFLQFYCSSGVDGYVRVWNNKKVPVAEIALDGSLGALCFMNEPGDILVSYMKHLFVIEHSRFMRSSDMLKVAYVTPPSVDLNYFSVHEDPAVRYEFGNTDKRQETIDIFRYLTPYNVENMSELTYLLIRPPVAEDQPVPVTPHESEDQRKRGNAETSSVASHDICFSPPVRDDDDCTYPKFGISPTQTPEPVVTARRLVSTWISPELEEEQAAETPTDLPLEATASKVEQQAAQQAHDPSVPGAFEKAELQLKDRLNAKLEEGFFEMMNTKPKRSPKRQTAASAEAQAASRQSAEIDTEDFKTSKKSAKKTRKSATASAKKQSKDRNGASQKTAPGASAAAKSNKGDIGEGRDKETALESDADRDGPTRSRRSSKVNFANAEEQFANDAVNFNGEDDAELEDRREKRKRREGIAYRRKSSAVLTAEEAAIMEAQEMAMGFHLDDADLPSGETGELNLRRVRPRTATFLRRRGTETTPRYTEDESESDGEAEYFTDEDEPELMKLESRRQSGLTDVAKKRVEIKIPAAGIEDATRTEASRLSRAKSAKSSLEMQAATDATSHDAANLMHQEAKGKRQIDVTAEWDQLPIADAASRKHFLLRYIDKILQNRAHREECLEKVQENRFKLEEEREARLSQALAKVENVNARYQEEKSAGFPSNKERLRIRIRSTAPSAPTSTPTPFAFERSVSSLSAERVSSVVSHRSEPLPRGDAEDVHYRVRSAAASRASFATSSFSKASHAQTQAQAASVKYPSASGRRSAAVRSRTSLLSEASMPMPSIPKVHPLPTSVQAPRAASNARDDEVLKLTAVEQRLMSQRFPVQYSQLVAALRHYKYGQEQVIVLNQLTPEQITLWRELTAASRSVSFAPSAMADNYSDYINM